ncbi:MAG: Flagellar hook-basal body complex protein FliE [Proteobacteria bacterium]|jgi:flagellar hook-basal body complex protein FliE|nr:MAG: Flagellar hook-basal body complex protein FliE [Pseudomonadota bacterium]|tara:strand:- start:5 stop:307 length:303 start_codon:yes stop_codon:yes gene_type:complete
MAVESIQNQVLSALENAPTTKASSTEAKAFTDLVGGALEGALEKQKIAEQLSVQAANDPGSVNMQDLITAVSEAELSLQTMVTMRDKTIEAYTKIMDMPI